MMIDIYDFGRRCDFSAEAISFLQEASSLLQTNDTAESVFLTCKAQLFAEKCGYWEALDKLAEQVGLHPFVVHHLFLIFCAEETRQLYERAGFSDNLYWDAMKDLKYKMEETYQLYGVWGVYCGWWLDGFLKMKCFCLGRLQFEIVPSEVRYALAGYKLNVQDPVINVHIPSFGRLGYEDVLTSYKKAASFFGHIFPDKVVWFQCETWMLYSPVNALLPEGNIKRFTDDFDVIRTYVNPGHDDRYRVFQMDNSIPVSDYPETTALQRNLKAWLLDGNTMGIGIGVFLWENERIVNSGR